MSSTTLTSEVTQRLEQAGLLDRAVEFSCYHSRGDEDDPRQIVIVMLALAGDPRITLTLRVSSDGKVIVWRYPGRPPDWIDDHSRIFTGQVLSGLRSFEQMVEQSIRRYQWMHHLYSTVPPVLADGLTVALWSHLHLAIADSLLVADRERQPADRSTIYAMTTMFRDVRLLDSMEHYRCHAWWVEEGAQRIQKGAIDLSALGPSKTHLQFAFSSEGTLELWATPNFSSTYQFARIFAGAIEPAVIEAMLRALLPAIGQTIDLYLTSNPMQDYAPLLRIWSDAKPTLEDPWSISQQGQEYLARKPPWWRSWV